MIFTYDSSSDPRLGHVIIAFNNSLDSQTIEVTPATPLPVTFSGILPIGPITISGLVSVQDTATIALLTEISAKLTLILARLPADNSEE